MTKFFTIVCYLILGLSITACSTVVPVSSKFPPIPTQLMEKCPQLKSIDGDNITMSQFTKTVMDNYTTYYECAIKTDAWIEWYHVQQKIYESK